MDTLQGAHSFCIGVFQKPVSRGVLHYESSNAMQATVQDMLA